jgi:hypothetical protein
VPPPLQEELKEGEEIARCPSCSLYITVIYNPVGAQCRACCMRPCKQCLAGCLLLPHWLARMPSQPAARIAALQAPRELRPPGAPADLPPQTCEMCCRQHLPAHRFVHTGHSWLHLTRRPCCLLHPTQEDFETASEPPPPSAAAGEAQAPQVSVTA